MNPVPKNKAYKVIVTGSFDYETYLRISGLLREFGSVQSAFFDAKSKKLDAAATFMVSTMHDADDMRVLLEQNPGVHRVLVEANHA